MHLFLVLSARVGMPRVCAGARIQRLKRRRRRRRRIHGAGHPSPRAQGTIMQLVCGEEGLLIQRNAILGLDFARRLLSAEAIAAFSLHLIRACGSVIVGPVVPGAALTGFLRRGQVGSRVVVV